MTIGWEKEHALQMSVRESQDSFLLNDITGASQDMFGTKIELNSTNLSANPINWMTHVKLLIEGLSDDVELHQN